MKKWITAFTIAAVTAFALPNDEVQLAMLSKMAQKKAIVLATMNLEGKKKEAFGTLYDEFQEKINDILAKRLNIIVEYAKNYKQLDDAKAQKLIDEWFKTEEDAIALKRAYVKKFKKIMSTAEVIRFLQVENRFEILRQAEISELVPLAQAPRTLPSK
ncbi:hypothetical protein [Hydrogenimonas urashimensis]|uniref:hypothetical protein n=1 Tax=Hydrogenimonas urashimensis TaxID=2740515 RepID=UPI001916BAD8|nr:hypothetical protein [Hydrogenimonas urashimensis]